MNRLRKNLGKQFHLQKPQKKKPKHKLTKEVKDLYKKKTIKILNKDTEEHISR
jgi:hypothetical protein